MKKIVLLLYIVMVIIISGCATTDQTDSGDYERPSSHSTHQGGCH